jgi:hypothetical protein
MSEMAAELGHSLLFPAQCWSCGRSIYLFAAPNGGFAIFNDIGVPWPKHRCPGRPDGPDVRFFPANFCPVYDIPVPQGVGFRGYDAGQRLKGAVARVRRIDVRRRTEAVFDLVLYNGEGLFKTCVMEELPTGAFVRGIATFVPEVGTCLKQIERLSPDQMRD